MTDAGSVSSDSVVTPAGSSSDSESVVTPASLSDVVSAGFGSGLGSGFTGSGFTGSDGLSLLESDDESELEVSAVGSFFAQEQLDEESEEEESVLVGSAAFEGSAFDGSALDGSVGPGPT